MRFDGGAVKRHIRIFKRVEIRRRAQIGVARVVVGIEVLDVELRIDADRDQRRAGRGDAQIADRQMAAGHQ